MSGNFHDNFFTYLTDFSNFPPKNFLKLQDMVMLNIDQFERYCGWLQLFFFFFSYFILVGLVRSWCHMTDWVKRNSSLFFFLFQTTYFSMSLLKKNYIRTTCKYLNTFMSLFSFKKMLYIEYNNFLFISIINWSN
jgi:hypothetical protein